MLLAAIFIAGNAHKSDGDPEHSGIQRSRKLNLFKENHFDFENFVWISSLDYFQSKPYVKNVVIIQFIWLFEIVFVKSLEKTKASTDIHVNLI